MFILDVQGFQHPTYKFVAKELALQALKTEEDACVLFEAPCTADELPTSFQLTNKWLSYNFHGLPWDSGFISYDEVRKTINHIIDGANIIFMKGLPKKQSLQTFTDKIVVNLEDLGCPRVQDLAENNDDDGNCWVHKDHSILNIYNCAYDNCQKLAKWYKRYFGASLEPSFDTGSWIHYMQNKTHDSTDFLKEFLLAFAWNHIDELWDKLPEKLRTTNIADYRRWHQHYPILEKGDCIDGPPPLVKNCSICRLSMFDSFTDLLMI